MGVRKGVAFVGLATIGLALAYAGTRGRERVAPSGLEVHESPVSAPEVIALTSEASDPLKSAAAPNAAAPAATSTDSELAGESNARPGKYPADYMDWAKQVLPHDAFLEAIEKSGLKFYTPEEVPFASQYAEQMYQTAVEGIANTKCFFELSQHQDQVSLSKRVTTCQDALILWLVDTLPTGIASGRIHVRCEQRWLQPSPTTTTFVSSGSATGDLGTLSYRVTRGGWLFAIDMREDMFPKELWAEFIDARRASRSHRGVRR